MPPLPPFIVAHAPLARWTTFRIGGTARFAALPRTREEVLAALDFAARRSLPVWVLGGGSNLLIMEGEHEALVLRLGGLRGRRFAGETLELDAGADLGAALREAARRGLGGLEGLAGVPGTVGGALRMNAGGTHGAISDCVEALFVVSPQGTAAHWSKEDAGFGYRHSRLNPPMVLGARFRLRPDDPARLRAAARTVFAHKRATQPLQLPSAGCVFRNPPGHSAGRLIDQAGCKGWREGDAEVSPRHANFLVNHGRATARQVLALAARVRDAVARAAGVDLALEIQVWGR